MHYLAMILQGVSRMPLASASVSTLHSSLQAVADAFVKAVNVKGYKIIKDSFACLDLKSEV